MFTCKLIGDNPDRDGDVVEKVLVKDFAYPNKKHYVDVVLLENLVNIDAAAAELVSKPHDGPPA